MNRAPFSFDGIIAFPCEDSNDPNYGGWTVRCPGRKPKHFATREEAIEWIEQRA